MKETQVRFQSQESVAVERASAGAARLLMFPTEREKAIIPLPDELAKEARKGTLSLITFEGDSLEGIGIFDGDEAVCQKVSKRDIKLDDICIVHILHLNDTLAKRLIHGKDTITLRSFHPDIPDMVLAPEQLMIQGVVKRLFLDKNDQGTFFRTPRPPRISRVERKQRVAAAIKGMTKPLVEEKFEF